MTAGTERLTLSVEQDSLCNECGSVGRSRREEPSDASYVRSLAATDPTTTTTTSLSRTCVHTHMCKYALTYLCHANNSTFSLFVLTSFYVAVCSAKVRRCQNVQDMTFQLFKARLQSCEKRLSTLSCLSVHSSILLSVRMKQLGSHWKDFDETWYLTVFFESLSRKLNFTRLQQEQRVIYMKKFSHL